MFDSCKQEIFNLSFSVSVKNEDTNRRLFLFLYSIYFILMNQDDSKNIKPRIWHNGRMTVV